VPDAQNLISNSLRGSPIFTSVNCETRRIISSRIESESAPSRQKTWLSWFCVNILLILLIFIIKDFEDQAADRSRIFERPLFLSCTTRGYWKSKDWKKSTNLTYKNFRILKLLVTTILDCNVRKYTIKILAKYVQIKIFFNKTTFAVDRFIKYTENYIFCFRKELIFISILFW